MKKARRAFGGWNASYTVVEPRLFWEQRPSTRRVHRRRDLGARRQLARLLVDRFRRQGAVVLAPARLLQQPLVLEREDGWGSARRNRTRERPSSSTARKAPWSWAALVRSGGPLRPQRGEDSRHGAVVLRERGGLGDSGITTRRSAASAELRFRDSTSLRAHVEAASESEEQRSSAATTSYTGP